MFGGVGMNDLWWYNPVEDTWTEKITNGAGGSPSARYGHAMVWDSSTINGLVIMFGGTSGGNELWWYDPVANTWLQKFTSITPSARSGHSMVWSASGGGQRVIMFGGYGSSPTYKNDLWWYDPTSGTNGAWINKTTTAISPSARTGHAMVWGDTPVGQRVIMFGGNDGAYKNDLWWYDPMTNIWLQKFTAVTPTVRSNHSMVWDPARGGMIMFGGSSDGADRNDLWWYDPTSGTNGAWIQMKAQGLIGSPSVRSGHSMVWDGARMIMFGGDNVATRKNDLWWYDPVENTWTEKITNGADGSPSPRRWHSMVWDPIGSRAIMFGGNDGAYKNDLWWWW
jgi:hypothetical protein